MGTKPAQLFLSDHVAYNDLVMVKVVDKPRPQTYRARIERIYTARRGIDPKWLGEEIEYVGGTGWGEAPLAVGDTGQLFVRKLHNGRFYEAASHGHMVVEETDGNLYAIFQRRELWLFDDVPSSIKDHSRQDPRRPYATAVRFDALETYLLALIEQVDTDGPPRRGDR
jgi:hypothetical protein